MRWHNDSKCNSIEMILLNYLIYNKVMFYNYNKNINILIKIINKIILKLRHYIN